MGLPLMVKHRARVHLNLPVSFISMLGKKTYSKKNFKRYFFGFFGFSSFDDQGPSWSELPLTYPTSA